MMHVVALLAAAEAPASASALPLGDLALALFLVALSLGLAVAEIFLASMGLFALGALGSAVAAIVLAFGISDATGWTFLVLVPLAGLITVAWGLRRLQDSRLVPKTAITADAGYHLAVERLGIAVGAEGVLVTDAVPSGRARFTGSAGSDECDVTVSGPAGRKGDRVRLLRIEGPQVTVAVMGS
jgi:membrane-bound ClpP family serine protease